MADPRPRAFRPMPSTRWGLVADAARTGDDRRRPALEELLARYMPALRAHLVLSRRFDPEYAEDLLQSFVMSKVLERAVIERADPSRGRFRSFMLTALDRFVTSQLRASAASKRAPTPEAVTALTEELEERHERHEPATVYEVEWARQVLRTALDRMLEQCRESGREDLWGVFEARLLAPLLDGVTPPPYDALLERFGFDSPAQASNALITAKRMFARTLRAVVGEYVQDPAQIELELRELKQLLAQSRT